MSKLNRREFKELFLEWKQNFINEKHVAGLDLFKSGLSDQNIEYIKSVNFPAYLLVIPFPFLFPFEDPNDPFNISVTKILKFEKSEKEYNKIKEMIKEKFKQFSSKDVKEKFSKEDLEYFGSQYKEIGVDDVRLEDYNPEEALEKIEMLFSKNKNLLLKEDFPVFIVFTKIFTDGYEADSGGLFKISELEEKHANEFLSWLYHHDFHHMIDKYNLQDPDIYNKKVTDILKNNITEETINLLNLSYTSPLEFVKSSISKRLGTFQTGDNTASVVPEILNMSKHEIENYIKENFIDFRKDVLDRSYMTKSLDDSKKLSIESEFETIKQDIIDGAVDQAILEVKLFNETFKSLSNNIIVSTYSMQ